MLYVSMSLFGNTKFNGIFDNADEFVKNFFDERKEFLPVSAYVKMLEAFANDAYEDEEEGLYFFYTEQAEKAMEMLNSGHAYMLRDNQEGHEAYIFGETVQEAVKNMVGNRDVYFVLDIDGMSVEENND